MTDDQKKALGVGGGAVGLLLLWRMRHRSSQQSQYSGHGGGGAGGEITPFTPQNPLVLQPGESIYDPNTLGLYDTPTAPYAGQSVSTHRPDYVVNVKYPKVTTKHHKRRKPTKRHHKGHKGKHTKTTKTTTPKAGAHH